MDYWKDGKLIEDHAADDVFCIASFMVLIVVSMPFWGTWVAVELLGAADFHNEKECVQDVELDEGFLSQCGCSSSNDGAPEVMRDKAP